MASCQPDRCFCEVQRLGWVRQPANSASSLAFVAVALLVLRMRSRHPGRASWRYAFALTLVGVGSAFFHASLTMVSQTADVLGMYLVATWFLVELVGDERGWTPRARNVVYLLGNAALLSGLVLAPSLRRYAFAALVLAVVWRAGARRRAFLPALGVLTLSFGIWTLDLTRVWCTPDAILQGHAVWHIGSAIAAWMAYRAFAGGDFATTGSAGGAIATTGKTAEN